MESCIHMAESWSCCYRSQDCLTVLSSVYSSFYSFTHIPASSTVSLEGAKVVLPSRKMFQIQVAGRRMQHWFGGLLLKLCETKGCGLMSKPSCGLWSSVLEDFHQFIFPVCSVLANSLSPKICTTGSMPRAGQPVTLTLEGMTKTLYQRVQIRFSSDQLPNSRLWSQPGV